MVPGDRQIVKIIGLVRRDGEIESWKDEGYYSYPGVKIRYGIENGLEEYILDKNGWYFPYDAGSD